MKIWHQKIASKISLNSTSIDNGSSELRIKAQKLNAQNLRSLFTFRAGSGAPQEPSLTMLSTETKTYLDGTTVTFTLRNGKREGDALQTNPVGSMIKFTFRNNKREGEALQTFPDGRTNMFTLRDGTFWMMLDLLG